jgi:non-specific protein-tyrosine kinase
VLLLEADLRHPTLVQQLGIRSGRGLADVLMGIVSLAEATQPVELEAPSGEATKRRTLDVLVAGAAPPPNPGELLESPEMEAVLEQARSAYDLVVIDPPPLTTVSDGFTLLTKVDGVVVVARIGHSRRDAAERLQQILAGSDAPVLGVIANGSNSKRAGYYAPASDAKPSAVIASTNGASPTEELVPTTKV